MTPCLLASAIILALQLAAQTETPPLPSFDAASVKVDDSGSSSSNWDDHPGRMTIKNGTLRALIERAYDLQANQIAGPNWLAPHTTISRLRCRPQPLVPSASK